MKYKESLQAPFDRDPSCIVFLQYCCRPWSIVTHAGFICKLNDQTLQTFVLLILLLFKIIFV